MCTVSWLESLKEEDDLEDLNADVIIILEVSKSIKWNGVN
jgi:hypothetical protein